MATKYPTAVADNKVGSVYESKHTTLALNVSVDPHMTYGDNTDPDEYVVTLNGRFLRRFTKAQAQRFGLTQERNNY